MKKVTRYCCPYCGKDNWDLPVCEEHRVPLKEWLAERYERVRFLVTTKVDQAANEITMEWRE